MLVQAERDRVASKVEESEERTANQRTAAEAVEAERRRRLLENPLGSPFARPGHHEQLSEEALEEENRRASSLLADAAAAAEKRVRVQEKLEQERIANLEEKSERKLNQTHAVLLTEAERQRRLAEDADAHEEEEKTRRHNVQAVNVAERREQADRITTAARETAEARQNDEQERVANQLKAVQLTEEERAAQIEAAAKKA